MATPSRRAGKTLPLALALMLAASGLAGALWQTRRTGLSAAAQPRPLAEQRDVPPVVAESFARAGLVRLANPRRRGPHYLVDGQTASGQPVRVVIHGATGAIVGLRVVVPAPAVSDSATGQHRQSIVRPD